MLKFFFAALLLLFAAFASAECILKVSVASPSNWAYAQEGEAMRLNFTAINLSKGGFPETNPSVEAKLGNDTTYTSQIIGPTNGYYYLDFKPYALENGQVGNITAKASLSDCVDSGASEIRFFYVLKKKPASVPDLHPALITLVALLALGIARAGKAGRRMK